MTGNMGHQATMAIAAAGTAIGSFTQALEFVSESLKKTGVILDTNGIRGTRSHCSERTRAGVYTVGGQITINPSPADLDILLPYIMGADEATDTFALGESLDSHQFAILVDRGEKRFVYDYCKVNSATIRGSGGGLIELVLDIVGKTEEASATAFPSIVPGVAANDAPYTMSDADALTLAGTGSREMTDFEITIDNALESRVANSETVTSIDCTDRNVGFNVTVPYDSSNSDLYGQALAGAAGSLVIENGNMSTTFTFATLQVPDDSPTVGGKSELPLNLAMVARTLSTTKELVITHDSTA